MKTLNAALIFRFIDRLSAPARAAARSIGTIEQAQRMASRASAQWSRGMDDLDGKLDRLAKVSLVTEGLNRAGRSMAAPLVDATRVAIGYDEQLAAIGDTAGLSANGVSRLDRAIRAASALGGRKSTEIAEAAAIYTAAGFSADVTERLLNTTTKVAVGARVGFADAGNAAVAFGQNLAVVPQEMERAFDAAHRAGQRGRFELQAMASAFPVVGAAAQRRGMQGTGAVAELSAALQIVRRQSADDSSAATGVRDMLNRFDSNETRNNFDKFGIDVVAAVARQRAQGASVIDAILNVTRDAQAKGAGLNQLFTEQDSQNAVGALLAFRSEFASIRTDAAQAAGVVETSFNRMRGTDAEKLKSYTAGMERLAIATGVLLAPAVGWAAGAAERLTGWMSRATQSSNPLARVAVYAAAGLAGIALAAGAVGSAVMGILGPWMIMQSLFGTMGGAAIMGGLAQAAGVIGRVRMAVLGLNVAMLANPVVLITAAVVAAIALVAGAAYLIYRNWGTIGPWLAGVWDGIKGLVSSAITAVTGFLMRWTVLGPITRNWSGIVGFIRATMELVGEVVGLGLDYVKLAILRFTPAGFILRNWAPITRIVGAVWQGVKRLVEGGLAAAGSAILRFTPLGLVVRNWGPITNFVSNLWNTARTIVSTGLSAIGTAITSWSPLQAFISAFASTFTWFQQLPGRFLSMGTNIVQGMTAGIRGQRAQVQAAAAGAAHGTAAAAAGALEINSPSRVFARIGAGTMEGLAAGLTRTAGLPLARAAAAAGALASVPFGLASPAYASAPGPAGGPTALIGMPSPGGAAAAAGGTGQAAPTQIVHHHYGAQTFQVSGEGRSIRELARELKRLGDAGARAAINDGGER